MKKNLAILLFLFATTSCVETAVIASLSAATVITREKTLQNTKDDVVIAAKIDAELLKNGLKTPKDSVSAMVNEGRVLLTGIVRDVEKGKMASEISWKVVGVKEVIDEIQVDKKGLGLIDFTDVVSDSFITSALKAKLFFKPSLHPSNYKITTIAGTSYLFGTALDEEDMAKVADIASKTIGVKKVVNHIILADDKRRR